MAAAVDDRFDPVYSDDIPLLLYIPLSSLWQQIVVEHNHAVQSGMDRAMAIFTQTANWVNVVKKVILQYRNLP